ncbi:MAG: phospho-N-acetylmuramoyl-pentapeptide-transferase [bacterium]
MPLAVVISFLVVALLGKPFIEFIQKINGGQNVSKWLDSHQTKQGTPTMGGLLMIFGVLVSFAIFQWMVQIGIWPKSDLSLLSNSIRFKSLGYLTGNDTEWALLGIILSFGFLGFLDDYILPRLGMKRGLGWKWKILLQFAIAVPFIIFNSKLQHGMPYSFYALDPTVLYSIQLFLAAMIIVWWVNALNLTDGLDGLAAGSSAIALSALAILAASDHSPVWLISSKWVIWSLVGSCLGFLWWNAPKAKMFMGDTGSMALGAAFAYFALQTNLAVQAFLVGGLFAIEALSVMIQLASVKLRGKRIFKSSPIHHHFEQLDWPESTIVIRFWLIALFFAGLGLWLFGELAWR